MEILFMISSILFFYWLFLIYRIQNGIAKSIPFKHIEGINRLSKGIDVKISFNKETIKIDDITIPISKINRLETTSSKQLVEQNGNVIGCAVLGGVLAGGVGAIVGGLSEVGNSKTTQLVHYLTIFFKDNSSAVFSFNGYSNKFGLKNAFKRINMM